ncbi:MAG: thiamine pyrophosphate-dependent enzyme [Syntrophales bacterium]|nr:thiamine pyrophosphate-dependent enzyme [Syntrophales bacterium]
MPETLFKINAKEYILPGNRSCQGCGLSLAYRMALKALREKTIMVLGPSCLCVLHGLYPSTAVLIPGFNTTFASAGAAASGLVAGLRALGRDNETVCAFIGDGGTSDMGIQSLSGAAERQTDFIYVCYDNEGYMNTGTQRSSATPLGAITTTTPIYTKEEHKKDLVRIMEAHEIPYIATANAAYPIDLYDKFVKAKKIKGTRYIHLFIPCPPGWGFPPKDTIKIGRLAVETGVFPLFEIENGKFHFTGRSRALAERGHKIPVSTYLERQARFQKMTPAQVNVFQQWVDRRWEDFLRRAEADAKHFLS